MAPARGGQRQGQPQQRQGGQAAVRSLRVGIALGDTFIDERLFRSREDITVGQSVKNTFSVPIENLPRTWRLFSIENGRYFLNFTDEMDGRLSDGKNVFTFDALKGRGANKRGDHWAVPLVETSRGKVELGPMKLLFQFVMAPPVQPKPRLPASVRGSLADRIDPVLAVMLAVCILLQSVVAFVAWQHDRKVYGVPEQVYREFEPDTFKDKVIAETVEVQTDETATSTESGEEEPKEPSKGTPNPGRSTQPDEGGGGGDAPDDATIAENIQDSAVIAAITGDSAEGGRYGKLNETDQGADLNKAIADASGKDIASIGGGDGRKTRGPNTGKIGGDKAGGKVDGPGSGDGTVATKVEEKVSRATFSNVEDLSMTTLDPNQVAKIIRSRYLQGIKRCHERVLKQDPTAGGRVNVAFTVGPTGGVTRASVRGFDPTVDACIEALARKWRFGAVKDDDGKPTSADFEIPLVLKPG